MFLPNPHLVGLGLHPVLFPEVEQLHGHWCYQVMTYHFGNQLTSQITMVEWIFDFEPGAQFLGYEGVPKGRDFFENSAIFYATYPLKLNSKRHFFNF